MGRSVAGDGQQVRDTAAGWRSWLRRGVSWLVLAPVYLWRATAVMRTPRCRYHPSCSSYAVESVRVHGPGRGSVLAVRRLGRCHPWQPGGIDPVPPRQLGDRPHRG